MRAPWILTIMLGALGVLGGAPATGLAAGFGPVRSLSPTHGDADSPSAAIAPSGQVAVLWRRTGRRSADYQYLAALGPDAEHLGRPVVVGAGHAAARTASQATLLARPDGGFVACFGSDPRRGAAVVGCAFAPPNGRFGPLRVVDRRPWRERLDFQAVMRADGQVVLLLTRQVGGRRQLRSATFDANGTLGGLEPLATLDRDAPVDLAAADDGTVAVTWAAAAGRDTLAPRIPSLRLMAPGQPRFGPPVRFTGDRRITSALSVQGGRQLRLYYSSAESGEYVVVARWADGSFTAPQHLPRPGKGELGGSVVSLVDGVPFAVTVAQRQAETDCGDITASVVGSGPLVPVAGQPTAQQLSTPGQIAVGPTAAALADGTVIASWGNLLGPVGATRVEVALRPPGAAAFLPSQVLPQISARETALAVGGDQAVLVWIVGEVPLGPAHVVVSALRRAPPYAPAARLPKHPRASCS